MLPGRDTARRYTNGAERDVTKQAVTVMAREIPATSREQQVEGETVFSASFLWVFWNRSYSLVCEPIVISYALRSMVIFNLKCLSQ